MAKIGILTYHRSLNYGAVMQAYALASEIKRRFPYAEVEIIDYMSKRMDRYYKMITLYRGRESAFHLKDRVDMYRAFQRGLKELPLSAKRMVSDDNAAVSRWLSNSYDVIIIGSDAVWNYDRRGLPNPYFPSDDGCYLSYAASCNGLGISTFGDIKPSERESMIKSFEKFSYIGARDLQTEALVHSVAPEIRVYHNCDPSLFMCDLKEIDRSALIHKLKEKYNFDIQKPTIGFMLSNHTGEFKRELAERIKACYGDNYQTVSLYSYNPYADIPYIADLTPQEWSIIFGLFKLTVSKYFHGTLFSLLNGTPVIAADTEGSIENMPNKLADVMDRLGISEYYFRVESAARFDWDELLSKADECLNVGYRIDIEERLSVERSESESFFDKLKSILDRMSFTDDRGDIIECAK